MITTIKNLFIGTILGLAIVFALGGPEENWAETWSDNIKEWRS